MKLLVELHLFHNFCPVLSCICQNSSHGCCDDKGSYFPANATPVRIFLDIKSVLSDLVLPTDQLTGEHAGIAFT